MVTSGKWQLVQFDLSEESGEFELQSAAGCWCCRYGGRGCFPEFTNPYMHPLLPPLHWVHPAPDLPCARPFLHQICPATSLLCTISLLHQVCSASGLPCIQSTIHSVLYPTPGLSCTLHQCFLYEVFLALVLPCTRIILQVYPVSGSSSLKYR